ncbi:MAG: hypothetical protein ACRDF4_00710, partial [Rhabdochlamydiaceae bacterium]
ASYPPNSNNDTRVLSIKKEALSLRSALDSKSARLEDLELRAKEISQRIETLETNKEPSDELLAFLQMKWENDSDLSLLSFRLSGMLKEINGREEKLRAEIRQLRDMISKLGICPACDGKGYLSKSRSYERMDDGGIAVNSETQECSLCLGTGKIDL